MWFLSRHINVLSFVSVASLLGTVSSAFADEENECRSKTYIGPKYVYDGKYTAPHLGFLKKGKVCKRPRGEFLTNTLEDPQGGMVFCALVNMENKNKEEVAEHTRYSWVFKHEKSGGFEEICQSEITVKLLVARNKRNFTVQSRGLRTGYDCKLYLNSNPEFGAACITPNGYGSPEMEDNNPISLKLFAPGRSCKTAGKYNLKNARDRNVFSPAFVITAKAQDVLTAEYSIEQASPEKFTVFCEVLHAGAKNRDVRIRASIYDNERKVLRKNEITVKSGERSATCKSKHVVKHTILLTPDMIGKRVGCGENKNKVKWLFKFDKPSGIDLLFRTNRLECTAKGFPVPAYFLPEYSEDDDPEIICKINNGLGESEHRERVSEQKPEVQKRFKSCESSPCTRNGKCYNVFDNFKCKCDSGWSGKLCEDNQKRKLIIIIAVVGGTLLLFVAVTVCLCIWQRQRVRSWMVDRDVSTLFQSRMSPAPSVTTAESEHRKPAKRSSGSGAAHRPDKAKNNNRENRVDKPKKREDKAKPTSDREKRQNGKRTSDREKRQNGKRTSDREKRQNGKRTSDREKRHSGKRTSDREKRHSGKAKAGGVLMQGLAPEAEPDTVNENAPDAV